MNATTLDELLEELEELRNELPGDTRVFLVHQPTMPLSMSLTTVVGHIETDDDEVPSGVYLAGDSTTYTPGIISDKLREGGWR